MDNFLPDDGIEVYFPQEYVDIIEELQKIMIPYNLDDTTLSSLVRASIEIEQQLPEPASRLFKLQNGKKYSVKPSNIKVNLKYALDLAFRFKTIFELHDIWLALAIISLIVNLFTNAIKEIDEISSIVILAIYRMQKGSEAEIFEQAKVIQPKSSSVILDMKSIQKSLSQLEDFKCIQLIDGKYSIIESVSSSLFVGI